MLGGSYVKRSKNSFFKKRVKGKKNLKKFEGKSGADPEELKRKC
jgi:hypothetical protein